MMKKIMNNDKFQTEISQTQICEKRIDTNLGKKIFLFVLSALVLVAAVSSVDAALCKGFDGYYHDCGYTYGHNSYGKSLGYGKGYGHNTYVKNTNVVYLNNYKKYNPINDYYIYSGPGYQRTHRDANVKYVSYKHKQPAKKVVYIKHHEPEVRKITYIRDERTYESRYHHNNDGRQLSIRLVGAEDHNIRYQHTSSCNTVRNEHVEPHGHNCGGDVITLGGTSSSSIWHDGNPYHHVSDHDHNIQSWKLKAEKSCVDGFNCASGDFY